LVVIDRFLEARRRRRGRGQVGNLEGSNGPRRVVQSLWLGAAAAVHRLACPRPVSGTVESNERVPLAGVVGMHAVVVITMRRRRACRPHRRGGHARCSPPCRRRGGDKPACGQLLRHLTTGFGQPYGVRWTPPGCPLAPSHDDGGVLRLRINHLNQRRETTYANSSRRADWRTSTAQTGGPYLSIEVGHTGLSKATALAQGRARPRLEPARSRVQLVA